MADSDLIYLLNTIFGLLPQSSIAQLGHFSSGNNGKTLALNSGPWGYLSSHKSTGCFPIFSVNVMFVKI